MATNEVPNFNGLREINCPSHFKYFTNTALMAGDTSGKTAPSEWRVASRGRVGWNGKIKRLQNHATGGIRLMANESRQT